MVGVQGVLRRHARTVREAADRREAPVHGEDPGQEHAPDHDPEHLPRALLWSRKCVTVGCFTNSLSLGCFGCFERADQRCRLWCEG